MASKAIADIVAEMRYGAIPKHQTDHELLAIYADRIEAAAKREADSIHRAMVLIAGIEMENPDDPPRLWTALDDAYDALSDALGTDGDTTADEEEAKATGRHFVVRSSGDRAKLREALETVYRIAYTAKNDFDVFAGIERIRRISEAALSAPSRNCDRPESPTTKQEGGNDEQK